MGVGVGGWGTSNETECDMTNCSVCIVCRVFNTVLKGMGIGGLNVTHVGRERIPLLWSIVGETALAKGFQVVRTCGIRSIRVTALRKMKPSETEGCTQ